LSLLSAPIDLPFKRSSTLSVLEYTLTVVRAWVRGLNRRLVMYVNG
jgi:hypothetical protein